MPGVLQFTLGIEVSKFLDRMRQSTQATSGLTSASQGLSGGLLALGPLGDLAAAAVLGLGLAMKGVEAAVEKAWRQVERGAALNDLSKRTGESVQNLFMLQKGFKAAGLSADSVGQAIFMLNKSLGGINEMGEDTASVFQKVGLSAEGLKQAGSAGAIQAVLQKMSSMNQTGATAFAGKIFGRGEAADMVQASRSMKEFNEAMAGAKAQAQVFQRVAAVFDTIEKTLVKVKAKLDPIWLVLAEKIAPVLKRVLDWINSIDLTPLGDALGNAWDVFAEAFSEGKVMELLSAGFSAAVEYLGNMLFAVLGDGGLWRGIWSMMDSQFQIGIVVIAKAFLNLGVILKAAITEAFNKMFEWIGKIPKLGKFLGMENYKADTFGETYGREKENAAGANKMLDELFGAGMGRFKGGLSSVGEAIGRAQMSSGGPAQDAFNDLVGDLLGTRKGRTKRTGVKAAGPGGDESFNLGGKGGEKPQVSELERMGFVLGGSGSGPMAITAKNTTMLVQLARQTLVALTGRHDLGGELNALPT